MTWQGANSRVSSPTAQDDLLEKLCPYLCTKGEKANKKQMACVGAIYSIEPFVRTADDILDEVIRHEKLKDRPEPAHKHVWAEMSREVDGEPLGARDAIFCACSRI